MRISTRAIFTPSANNEHADHTQVVHHELLQVNIFSQCMNENGMEI